jgi:hypothetical protein
MKRNGEKWREEKGVKGEETGKEDIVNKIIRKKRVSQKMK